MHDYTKVEAGDAHWKLLATYYEGIPRYTNAPVVVVMPEGDSGG